MFYLIEIYSRHEANINKHLIFQAYHQNPSNKNDECAHIKYLVRLEILLFSARDDINVSVGLPIGFFILRCVCVAQVYEDLEKGGGFEEGCFSHSDLFISVHDAALFSLNRLVRSDLTEQASPSLSFPHPHNQTCCLTHLSSLISLKLPDSN